MIFERLLKLQIPLYQNGTDIMLKNSCKTLKSIPPAKGHRLPAKNSASLSNLMPRCMK